MKRPAIAICLGLLALGACAPADTATRNTPAAGTLIAPPAQVLPLPQETLAPGYRVAALSVEVPRDLKVSEANLFLPPADIVWRGEAFGDRYEQVRALFEEAFDSARLSEGRPANVAIRVLRFHGLTEKARFVTGGVYAIHFEMRLTDPRTGAAIGEPRLVKINHGVGRYRAAPDNHATDAERWQVIGYIRDRLEKELGPRSAA